MGDPDRCRQCPDRLDYGDHTICRIYGWENPGLDYECPDGKQIPPGRGPDKGPRVVKQYLGPGFNLITAGEGLLPEELQALKDYLLIRWAPAYALVFGRGMPSELRSSANMLWLGLRVGYSLGKYDNPEALVNLMQAWARANLERRLTPDHSEA